MYHGYIVVQEGVNLRPDEFRGIMIRIKDVAVGYYDTSMLDYRTNSLVSGYKPLRISWLPASTKSSWESRC